MTTQQKIAAKIEHKQWIQNEIIQLEIEGSKKAVEMYKADLVRIENELFELTKAA